MARGPRPSWIQCVRDQLKQRGYGDTRADEIETQLKNLSDRYARMGEPMPEARATSEIMAKISRDTQRKAREAVDIMEHIAETNERLDNNVNNVRRFKQGLAPVAESYMDFNAAIEGAHSSMRGNEALTLQRLWSIGNQIAVKFGKGIMGVQKGKAHLPNIAREVIDGFGSTGDRAAEMAARAWVSMTDAGVDLFNKVGGAMDKLERYMPQNWSPARLFHAGVEDYVAFHQRALAWDRMSHPDGSPILPGARDKYLRDVWNTITKDGADKLTPESAGAGRGSNVGNQLDVHRQLHYRDGEAWLEAFNKYSDGTIFDLMQRHVASMARDIALVQTFGPNPSMGMARIRAQTLRKAADIGDAEFVRKTQDAMDRTFGYETQARAITQQSPMSEFSSLAQGTAMFGSVLRAAELGSAVMASVADIPVAVYQRLAAGKGFGSFHGIGEYLSSWGSGLTGINKSRLTNVWARSGIVGDDHLNAVFEQKDRFYKPFGTFAPALADAFAAGVWRLGSMNFHDTGMRRFVLSETMGFLHDSKDEAMAALPEAWQRVMKRYGITAKDWDAFRTNCPETERGRNAKWLVPTRILETSHPDKEALYNKFAYMLHAEAYLQFMNRPTVAVQSWARNMRADSLLGAIMSSALMYKSFPMTLMSIVGRSSIAQTQSTAGRVAYIGGLVAALTMTGLVVNAAKNLLSGRDVDPLDAKSIGAAMIGGGGLGFAGDLLRGASQDTGAGVNDVIAGPMLQTAGKIGYAGFQWAKVLGAQVAPHAEWTKTGKHTTKAAEAAKATLAAAKAVTPGSTLWYARLALQREVWDKLEMVMSPDGHKAQQTRIKNAKTAGAPFWWNPGADAPQRAPNLNPLPPS